MNRIGSKLGKYEIVGQVGRGGMGVVFRALDSVLEREVALKVMGAAADLDPELGKRFEREAKAIARLQHPNIVTVYDLGYDDQGAPFIAMELLRGLDLEATMKSRPPTPRKKLDILVKTCAGLGHAHEKGIVHRDIKPANIFITDDGGVKIMDFGVARLAQSNMTQQGTVLGTVAFMAPEQLEGKEVDGRADLFSLGVILYSVLSHQQPFQGENISTVISRILCFQPPRLTLPEGDPLPEVEAILARALAKDPDDRYQTAEEFGAALASFAAVAADRLPVDLPLLPDAEGSVIRMVEAFEDGGAMATREPLGARVTRAQDMSAPTIATPLPIQPPRTVEEERAPAHATMPVEAPTPAPPAPAPAAFSQPARAERPTRNLGLLAAAAALVVVVGGGGWYLQKTRTDISEPSRSVAGSPEPAEPAEPAETQYQRPPAVTEPASELESQPATDSSASPAAASTPVQAATEQREATTVAQSPDPAAEAAAAKARQVTRLADDASTAIAAGRLDRAEELLAEASSLEPSNPRLGVLRDRLDEGRLAEGQAAAEAERLAAARTEILTAARALAAGEYEAAIAAYDRALDLDPANATALDGLTRASGLAREQKLGEKNAAVAQRELEETKTTFHSGKRQGAAPQGFASGDVAAKRASGGPVSPGEVLVEMTPRNAQPGDPFVIRIRLHNKSNRPMHLKSLELVGELGDGVHGRGQSIAPKVRRIEPRSTAVVYELTSTWTEARNAGRLTITIELVGGASFTKGLSW